MKKIEITVSDKTADRLDQLSDWLSISRGELLRRLLIMWDKEGVVRPHYLKVPPGTYLDSPVFAEENDDD
jgi:hypothetical protein